MPHACTWAASGVIGNQLFIAGGDDATDGHRRCRFMTSPAGHGEWVHRSQTRARVRSMGYVVDGKLCVMNRA